MSKLLDGNFYFPVDGHFVSQKQIRINEILRDYDPNLQLQFIPPDQRSDQDIAFRVVAFPPGRAPYAVCFSPEADERLLARVFEADQSHGPNRLTFLENYERARELVKAKEAMEQRQEDHAIAQAVLRNNKSSYKVRINGELIDLERPGHCQSRPTHIWR